MPNTRPLAFALGLCLIALAAAPDADAQAKKKKAAAKAPAVPAVCTDFYAAANADWLKANPVPADGSTSAFGQLAERARMQQKDLLDAAMSAPQGNVQKLLGDFYASGLDEAAVEADGSQPIAPLLTRINAIKKAKDIAPAIAALHQVGIPVAFNFSPDVDLKQLDRHIGYFLQGGVGLSDPAFYTRKDPPTVELMGRYRNYVSQILALTGTAAADLPGQSAAVIQLETLLSQNGQTLHGLSDPFTNYVPVSTKDIAKQYKNLQLDAFLKAQGVTDDTVSLADPKLFAQINTLITQLPADQWKAYLRYRVGDSMAPYLSKGFRTAEFEFRGRVLRGEPAPAARWSQVLDAINIAAGPMLGREYTARYLPDASISRANTVATDIRDALVRSVQRSSVLDAPSKAEAVAKLEALKIEVGRPKRDLDYTVQPMGRGSFGGNMLIASTWRHREEMKRIGKGNADRRWSVLPQQPTLAYDIAQNRLIVTAAVLQPPVFDNSQDIAGLYGAYGALVGHELNRAIDTKGRQVDAKGELRDWWTPADVAAYGAVSNRLNAQYDSFPYPGVTGTRVNGRMTQDQNLADLAGVELAMDAYNAKTPGATPAQLQLLFQGWARLWAQQSAPAAAAERATTDVRAPGQWRANGPLVNQPAFGTAYSCKAGTPMQKAAAEQVTLWR